ncbi:enolase 4 [Eucyclogobius newberryi]|uniref:enolase 4 n=1 Tax=Eucyclogobius newberryi TaxID=166745 RepID=UPI003B5AD93E
MLGLELAVLRGFLTQSEAAQWKQLLSLGDVGPLLELFFGGDFRGVLQSPLVQGLLCGDSGHVGEGTGGSHVGEGTDLETHLEKRMKRYLSSAPEDEHEHRELVLLLVAVSSLQMFAQNNWTGPSLELQEESLRQSLYSCRLQEFSESQNKPDECSGSSLSNTTDTAAPGNKKGKKGSAVKPQPPPEPLELLPPEGLAVGALSLCVARAGAQSRGVPLYHHIAALRSTWQTGQLHVPSLLVSVLSCGKSSPGKLHLFEEVFLIPKPGLGARQVSPDALPHMPSHLPPYSDVQSNLLLLQIVSIALDLQTEFQRILSARTKAEALGALPSDSGAPCLIAERPEQPLELLGEACSNLGLSLGSELFLGLSCAAPGLFSFSKGKYEAGVGMLKSPDEMVELLQALVIRFPSVVALVDPLRREDREQWERLGALLSDTCSLLSDVTYREQGPPPPGVRGHILKHAHHVTISDLIRVSAEQEGSVLLGTSHGEPSSDPALPDLAVGLGLDFLKMGGLCGAERTSQYNRIIAIEDELEREGRLFFKEELVLPIFPQRPASSPESRPES